MAIVKNYQIYAQLAEFGLFEGVAQPEFDIQTDDYFPASASTPQKLPSTGKFGDINWTRAYDPSKDSRVVDWVTRYQQGIEGPRQATVFVNNDQGIVQASRTYLVKPVGYKEPDGKSGDGGISEFTLKLAVETRK